MDEFWSFISSSNMIALGVSIVIFLVTVNLLAKQLINFFVSLVLIFFALVSGWAIANNSIVKNKLQEHFNYTPSLPGSQGFESSVDAISSRLKEIFDRLVQILSNQDPADEQTNHAMRTQVQTLLHELDIHRGNLQALLDQQQPQQQQQYQR